MRLLTIFLFLLLASIAMPSYATPADIADAYGTEYVAQRAGEPSGTFDAADATDAVTVTLQKHLDATAGEIDAKLRSRYGDVPTWEDVPDVLTDLNAEAAFLRMCRFSEAGLDEAGRADQKRVDATLASLASGATVLPVSNPVDAWPGDDADERGYWQHRTTLFGRTE